MENALNNVGKHYQVQPRQRLYKPTLKELYPMQIRKHLNIVYKYSMYTLLLPKDIY
jgi:hypothetical protein